MNYSDAQIWTIILVMAVFTFLIRFSFLGLVGDRQMPDWVLRHLRYTPVAVLPGLVAPLVIFPDGGADPAKMAAALVTLLVAWWRKSMMLGAVAGASVLALINWLT